MRRFMIKKRKERARTEKQAREASEYEVVSSGSRGQRAMEERAAIGSYMQQRKAARQRRSVQRGGWRPWLPWRLGEANFVASFQGPGGARRGAGGSRETTL